MAARGNSSVLVTEKEIFPTKLRRLMSQNNISQEKLAEFLGVSRQAIGQYRQGRSYPDWKAIAKIAEFFGVSTDFLITDTEIPCSVDRNGTLSATAIQNITEYIGKPVGKNVMHNRQVRKRTEAVNYFFSSRENVKAFFDGICDLRRAEKNALESVQMKDEHNRDDYANLLEDVEIAQFRFNKAMAKVIENLFAFGKLEADLNRLIEEKCNEEEYNAHNFLDLSDNVEGEDIYGEHQEN